MSNQVQITQQDKWQKIKFRASTDFSFNMFGI